jgi:hypothetical protein
MTHVATLFSLARLGLGYLSRQVYYTRYSVLA